MNLLQKFRPTLWAAALTLAAIGIAGCATAQNPTSALSRLDAPAAPPVLTGLDVLEVENFARLRGKKVGIIGNHSSINRRGVHILDLLVDNGIEVVSLFAPEHGFRGTEDRAVGGTTDPKTGLPIYSLYDQTRSPLPEELEGVEVLIFDMQDIGARFYTYIATMGNCMRVAQEHDITYMVLDRPNPIQGNWYDGPIQDPDLVDKFTAYVLMPVAHGMTVGEIARLYEKHHGITPKLEVVAMKGWQRDMYYDETGLPWVNPSPNMRSVDEELLYTMVALTEANHALSVGRGTDRPFEYLGAPWMDSRLAEEFNKRNLPGLWFMDTTFIPSRTDITGRENYPYPHHGQVCNGVRIVVVNRHTVSPVVAGIHMLDLLVRLYPEHYTTERLRGLVGAQWVLDAINEGRSPDDIVRQWRSDPEFAAFAARRASVLMY